MISFYPNSELKLQLNAAYSAANPKPLISRDQARTIAEKVMAVHYKAFKEHMKKAEEQFDNLELVSNEHPEPFERVKEEYDDYKHLDECSKTSREEPGLDLSIIPDQSRHGYSRERIAEAAINYKLMGLDEVLAHCRQTGSYVEHHIKLGRLCTKLNISGAAYSLWVDSPWWSELVENVFKSRMEKVPEGFKRVPMAKVIS